MLLYNSASEYDRSTITKVKSRWFDSYRIHSINSDKENYILKKLDRIVIRKSVTEQRIKRFFSRDTINPLTKVLSAKPYISVISDNVVTLSNVPHDSQEPSTAPSIVLAHALISRPFEQHNSADDEEWEVELII